MQGRRAGSRIRAGTARPDQAPAAGIRSRGQGNLESPLHLYYRWRCFSYLQGDTDQQWRTEPFQVSENGPVWLPPACVKPEWEAERRAAARPATVQRSDLASKPRPGVGGADLAPDDEATLDRLISEVITSKRASILEAMVFCLDNASASQVIAQRICSSITEGGPDLTVAQASARFFLLSDVLHNAHSTRAGASMYRRQFQEYMPDVFERLRALCPGLSPIALGAFQERLRRLLETWIESSPFPRTFVKGLQATLYRRGEGEEDSVRWKYAPEESLERECRLRGLSSRGAPRELVERLSHFDAYWGEALVEDRDDDLPPPDPELDGEPLGPEEGAPGLEAAPTPGDRLAADLEAGGPTLGDGLLAMRRHARAAAEAAAPKASSPAAEASSPAARAPAPAAPKAAPHIMCLTYASMRMLHLCEYCYSCVLCCISTAGLSSTVA